MYCRKFTPMNKFLPIGLLLLFIGAGFSLSAQNPKFDNLEMLFEQGHYKRVYRKSNRLMDKPEYDFSVLPKYYKSLALFQLTQNEYWRLKNKQALDEAIALFREVKESDGARVLFDAHMYELEWVKSDLLSWSSDLNRLGKREDFLKVQQAIKELFDEVESVEPKEPVVVPDEVDTIVDLTSLSKREQIVEIAKKYIGVPYVWAGSTPEGFDCSGFTGFVLKEIGQSVPRRSADQYADSRKVKKRSVERGDLIFFSNGSGVSHVGIIISKKGEPVQMIHASTSKGVIISDVDTSTYWVKRVHGYGTYFD
jgi:hypothetical protein